MIQFKKLTWDSDFFQKEIYRVVIRESFILSQNDILEIRNKENRFFYLFSKSEQPLLVDFLMDDKVFYKKSINNISATTVTIYNSQKDSKSKLLELAYDAGMYSRFRLDPLLGLKFKEMYAMWLDKSLSGELADFVLVEKKDNSILGFVTIKEENNKFSIGLIAVDAASRGLGVGRGLLEQCDNLALSRNINSIVVPTQRENKQACSFYLKNGFVEWKHEYIYHINTYENPL